MADVKWIKVSTSMFEGNRKIKQIELMPEGDTILVIWLKLLLLAGNVNDRGAIYITPEIPYTDEMLANELRRPITVVRMALSLFERFGMIEIIDNVFYLSSWEKYQSADKLEEMREQNRKRVARHREKQKAIALNGEHVCQYCGGESTGVDHIVAVSRGGKDTDDNKVPCCLECNRIKNDKPLVDFLNANRNRINDALIAANPKLSKRVSLCNVTDRYIVTLGNATEEERDLEKEFHSFTPADKSAKAMELMGGTLGKGVVMISDEQFNDLLDKLSLDELHKYMDIVADCELKGKRYKNKTHYQAILDMVAKDRRVAQ